ncbi:MAG: EAL domain-containing response regulator, partial [Pseudomonadota bacterium]
LVIMDLNMPGHDGFSFLQDLAEREYTGPVVIASGEQANVLSSAKQIARRLKLAPVATIAKPVTIPDLESAVAAAKAFNASRPMPRGGSNGLSANRLEPALVYQLQFNTFTNSVSGSEALLRARNERGEFLGPGPILSKAKTPEAAFELTGELLEIFCREVAQMRALGCRWPFSFNVDARPLEDPRFVELAKSLCDRNRLEPEDVVLELTEQHLPKDPSILLSTIARLRMAGFRLAMDDFSTGAASFDMLRDGAFSEVKLDMDLTKSAVEFEASRAFIRNLVGIAQDLDLRLVAEGIETENEERLMEALGVRHMQGYRFGRPVPAKSVLKLADELSAQNFAQ